jgi:N-acetylglucosamine-6-phosphate deacetylase
VGVQNLVKWGICDVESAILLATNAPRKAIGLPEIVKSQPANLLRWHCNETTKELTWRRVLTAEMVKKAGDWNLSVALNPI